MDWGGGVFGSGVRGGAWLGFCVVILNHYFFCPEPVK